jgi:hypothetical protein
VFGHDNDDKQERTEQWRLAMRAELGRLSALPVEELAVEVMIRGFGPGGPGADDDAISLGQANIGAGPTAGDISLRFVPDRGFTFPVPTPEDVQLRDRMTMLVAEGLQELEHASLVRCQVHTAMGTFDWAATRRGRAALERGAVEHIMRTRALNMV